MNKDLTKKDFVTNRTDFRAEYNAMREQLFKELYAHARAKSWLSALFYRLTKEPVFKQWN
jgi:hypothetical protein